MIGEIFACEAVERVVAVGCCYATSIGFLCDIPVGIVDVLISHLGLIQLVDLLVGLNVDPSALRRLLWTVHIADAATALKNYLLTRALEHYDAAMLYRMGDLLDEFVHKYVNQAELEAVQLTGAKGEEQPKTQRFLDRVDDEFFAYMAEEMKKLKNIERRK